MRTIICDRCGKHVENEAPRLWLAQSPLIDQTAEGLQAWDLCQHCHDLLISWLKPPEPVLPDRYIACVQNAPVVPTPPLFASGGLIWKQRMRTERKAGRRGARESHEPRLLLSQFRTVAPTGYQEWDGTHGITEWGMDGNDTLGDCGAAATDHGNMAKADDVALLNTLGNPKYAGTEATYFAYGIAMGEPGPNPDQGVDNATWLGFLYKNGIIDGYGEVPLTDLDAYAQDFNGLLLAVALDDAAEQQFEAHQPWDGTPDPNEGHDIWLIVTHADGSIEVITWGALQACTLSFRLNNVTDAWAILDEDDAKRTGVDWTALQQALVAIHGVAQ